MLIPIQNPGAYWLIRPNIIEGINRYVLWHQEVGHFLTAVLTNDLREALARADDENIKTILQIVSYCHNEIPGVCWGSVEAHKKWVEMDDDDGAESYNKHTAPSAEKELERQMGAGIWCRGNWIKEREGASRGTEG